MPIIESLEKEKCYGCGACAVICPEQTLAIVEDDLGFLYPIKESDCCGCELCIRVCPATGDGDLKEVTGFDVYSAYVNARFLRKECSSGGVALSLGLDFLVKGGIYIGAVYSEDFRVVRHVCCKEFYEAVETIGSKYVQSYCHEAVKEILAHKGPPPFIFVGTPCQVAATERILRMQNIRRDSFVLVDFFCHGVASYRLWRLYLASINKKVGTVLLVNQRKKITSWHDYCVEIIGTKGAYRRPFRKDFFGKAYLHNYALRPTCYRCRFVRYSAADIRIGDFWGSDFENDRLGTSIVIPMTNYGHAVLSANKRLVLQKMPKESLERAQGLLSPARFNIPRLNTYLMQQLANDKCRCFDVYMKYLAPKDMRRVIGGLLGRGRRNAR